ncbi:hypothetical protein HYR99_32500 [Candidatus Poribacteria bacterium]|nr:hypothetical protein [Candidatus Poribacteria bacterium]
MFIRSVVLTVVMVSLATMGGGAWADGSDTPGQSLIIADANGNGVFIPDDPDINPNSLSSSYAITWEFWIKPLVDVSAGISKSIFAKFSTATICIAVLAVDNTGPDAIAVFVNNLNITPAVPRVAAPLTLNRWQHIAIVLINNQTVSNSPDVLRIYKNGVLVQSIESTDNINFGNPNSTASLVIGDGMPSTTVTSFQCEIDEFRVWAGTGNTDTSPGVRSQAEIQANMTLSNAVVVGADTLGARFSFDSGIAPGPDDTGKVTVISILGVSTGTSEASIGDTVSKSLATGPISFDSGGVETDLDLNNISITTGTDKQITVARIRKASPNLGALPSGVSTQSQSQYWLISHEGSSGKAGNTVDAVGLTANVALNLNGQWVEQGVTNPTTLMLLEASNATKNQTTGADQWANDGTADGSSTITNVVFPNITVFTTSGTAHWADVYTMGGAADNPLPVELASFNAQAQDGRIVLRWATASESDNLGFNVYRSRTPNGSFTKLNSRLIPGLGTSGSGREYQWMDDTATEGAVYYYYIEDVSLDGQTERSAVFPVMPKGQPATLLTPTEPRLFQNYPNAFNPDTWIPYQLNQAADVLIQIYDIQGNLIRTLTLGQRPAGYYLEKGRAAYWDGRNQAGERVTSGTYFYRFQAGDFVSLKKMVLLK